MSMPRPNPWVEDRSTPAPSYNVQAVQNSGGLHSPQLTFVRIDLTELPREVTTLDVYRNLNPRGNVTSIKIFETGGSNGGARAEVRFEPPPDRPFWDRRINFNINGTTKRILVRLNRSAQRHFTVKSPLRCDVSYNGQTVLLGSVLKFGVMLTPCKMMTMKARQNPDDPPRLVLDPCSKEITVFFPHTIHSENRSASRSFRFSIALDESFTIWSLPGSEYILQLTKVPWYSKQLKEAILQTHAPSGKRWSDEDTWARQTDIVDQKQSIGQINKTPIALQKNLNSINIARWTTFKINLVTSQDNMDAEKIFRTALRDFNVDILDGRDIKVVTAPPDIESTTWGWLGGNIQSDVPRSLAEQWSEGKLPFTVEYQLHVCISHGWISEYSITPEFLQKLAATDEDTAENILKYVALYQERVWNPMKIFNDLCFRRPVKLKKLPGSCMETRSATVTASGILFNTPTVEVTNRVIRRYKQYADRFLRVRFEDDDYRGQTKIFPAPNNKMILIFHRVKRVLRHGIELGGVHYQFLAWGNSQLREHGAYFFARVGNVTASSIRAEMGAFDQEKVVARRAARMGQCFSTTKPVELRIPMVTKKNTIPDIKSMDGKYNYTDGVGMISRLAAHLIHQQLKIKGPIPSTFQFRLGGCKGVLVVWPELQNIEVRVRESQFKFNSSSGELEIIRWSEFWQPFLNRQLIICLSELGVTDSVFLRKQEDTIDALEAAMVDDIAALKALRDNVDPNMMTISMCELVAAGFRGTHEPFVTSLLQLWRAWSLKYLKEKAKIPISQGAFVLGCADETGTLRGHYNTKSAPSGLVEDKIDALPEIFIQILNPQTGKQEVKTGLCILARNPSLHRGDIRVVMAVDREELRHLRDVVVMPTNGDRDLPSMCSGGDLDGDDYIVIWDQDLLPEVWNVEPFHYEAPPPRTAANEINTEDIINFFCDYMQNDYLGRIAHAHLAAADDLDDGLQSSKCLELCHLHSMAVDYPKTGVPATMPRSLEPNQYPHFMEKKARSYRSHKILGRLYDAVERVAFSPSYNNSFDARILNAGKPTESLMMSITVLKSDYDLALQRIMAQHEIRTEFEVWSTFVLDHSKASGDFKFHEEIGRLSAALKEQYHEALTDLAGGKDFDHLVPVAVAAYQYTNGQVQAGLREISKGERYDGPDGMPFMSFPWLLQDVLCKIARRADSSNTTPKLAIIKNGEFSEESPAMHFDEQGRAQIEVVDDLDVSYAAAGLFSIHLPDPYEPEFDEPRTGAKLEQSTDAVLDIGININCQTAAETDVDGDKFRGIELLEEENPQTSHGVSKETVAQPALLPRFSGVANNTSNAFETRKQLESSHSHSHSAPRSQQVPLIELLDTTSQPNPLSAEQIERQAMSSRKILKESSDNSRLIFSSDKAEEDHVGERVKVNKTPFASLKKKLNEEGYGYALAEGIFANPDRISTWLEQIDNEKDLAEAAGINMNAATQVKDLIVLSGDVCQKKAIEEAEAIVKVRTIEHTEAEQENSHPDSSRTIRNEVIPDPLQVTDQDIRHFGLTLEDMEI